MKTVNLVPEWYVHQQRQKRNLHFHLCIMMLMGCGIVASMTVARAQQRRLEFEQHQLENRVVEVGNLDPELLKKKAELKRVVDIQAAYRELGNTVPMSAVVQQIQNDMTAGMALSRVSIEIRPEPVKGSGFVGDTKHPPRYHDVAHLTVVGIAPNDVQIAQLIGKITSNPLFGDCSLNFTRTEMLRDYSVRRFEIQMQMDLEPLATEVPDGGPKRFAEGAAYHAR